MEKFVDILRGFLPISLEEMDAVKLMDRMDTKFMFRLDALPRLLQEVKPYYNCLQIKNNSIATYRTLYYDTVDLKFYHQHHNGQLNRYKIRYREYVDSKIGYLELKFKTNKGRTVKKRIRETVLNESFDESAYLFLQKELDINPHRLMPILWVNYQRITLVNKISAERVTIDLNLEFKKDEKQVCLNNLVIAEVKQEKKANSPFLNVMKKMHIREGSISKYCFAVAFIYDHIKTNNFKEKLVSLKYILNNDTPTNIG